jgi:hypothetical protein
MDKENVKLRQNTVSSSWKRQKSEMKHSVIMLQYLVEAMFRGIC